MSELEEIKMKITKANWLTPFSKSEVDVLIAVINEKEEEIQRLETELMMSR